MGRGVGGVPGGHGWGEGLQEGGPQGGSASVRALCCVSFAVCEKKQEGGRREEKRREEKKEKRKEEGKKGEKKERKFFSNLKISEKIKDTLRSWSKIIFVEERYLLNYK
jgi:hypothetical protein